MRPTTCTRWGCTREIQQPVGRGRPRKFCSKRCGTLDRRCRKHDGDPPLTATAIGYLEAFERHLRENTAQSMSRRESALADLKREAGIT